MTDELFQRADVKMLADYFAGREDVVMAFLFGSRAAKGGLEESDWDIACYLDSGPGVVECGAQRTYSQESEIVFQIYFEIFSITSTASLP